ncbi:hypothetical protein M3Y99_00295400 [Aphelenchoides fujianensis]|nr:hypothetical protein M3Y99_00295400 [Aphelenchoides fujianensis]
MLVPCLLLFLLLPLVIDGSTRTFPCINGRIMIAVDVSTELTAENFQKEIAFLSNNVFTDEWTDLDRLTLVQYDEVAWGRPFGARQTAAAVRLQLEDAVQHSPPNLTRAFETIDQWQAERAEESVNLIVLVSSIDQKIVHASLPLVSSLLQKNYRVSFVAVGHDVSSQLLGQLQADVLIEWDVDEMNVPIDWYQQFLDAYGCASGPITTPLPCVPSSTNFLVNAVFAGNWNHLERLGVTGITNKLNEYLNFGDLADDGPQDLKWLRGYVAGLNRVNVNLGLPFAFQSLRQDFNADNYGEVHYVVFLGSLTTQDVRALAPIARRLQAKGRLTLIGVGGGIVPEDKYLEKLSNYTAYWTDPTQPFPGDWNQFFWQTAYKCAGEPPPAPSTIGTVQPVTRAPTTPTTPTPPLPCAGRLVVIVDVSGTLDIDAYNNEIDFVGNTLFANSFFTRFDRLAIGMYNQEGPVISEALATVAGQWYVTDQTTPLVVLVFVSKISQNIVTQARAAAQPLYDNNVRLVLVGLSTDLDLDLMNQITNGAGTTVVNWNAKLFNAPSRFPTLFTTLWCPGM